MLCSIFSYDYVADCRKSILNDIRKISHTQGFLPIDFWFCEWSRIYFTELNTFFGKHYFRYPAKHWLCWGRMLFMGPVSAPAIKQYYSYATDTRCKRLGNHAWVS